MGLDLGLCLQGHTKWVRDFSTLVGVYKDGNIYKYSYRYGRWNTFGYKSLFVNF
jgi:hypothetical protein